MMKNSAPFDRYEAENRVITRIAQASHVSEADIRKLVQAEDTDSCDKLADGLRIEELNAKFGPKLCPTCGGSV